VGRSVILHHELWHRHHGAAAKNRPAVLRIRRAAIRGAVALLRFPLRLRRPVLRGLDPVALHLEVQGFVVGAEDRPPQRRPTRPPRRRWSRGRESPRRSERHRKACSIRGLRARSHQSMSKRTNGGSGQVAVRTRETPVANAPERKRARHRDRCGAEYSGLTARYGAHTMAWSPEFRRRLRRPEIRGLDRVALHLEMESLVVDSEKPSRLTLVATRGEKSQAYRLPLRLGGRAVGDLLQRETRLPSWPAIRSCHAPRGHRFLSPHRADRTQLSDQRVRYFQTPSPMVRRPLPC
jgi:hypothetical protein